MDSEIGYNYRKIDMHLSWTCGYRPGALINAITYVMMSAGAFREM